MKIYKLEMWSDSFHEGFWACQKLGEYIKIVDVEYLNGFIPVFKYQINPSEHLQIVVLGSYKNWSPIPKQIEKLLEWGKPDLILYDSVNDKIIVAMEETAAVPTGNQALQRCERMYGSLRARIPFWYLIGEFGVHKDGGIRRDSIWPTILGIKLSCFYNTPCIVIHYSDKENPEDYTIGDGVNKLFKSMCILILQHFGLENDDKILIELEEQYKHMLNFVHSQWKNIIHYLPKGNHLEDAMTPKIITNHVMSKEQLRGESSKLFTWETTKDLPSEIYNGIRPSGIIKNDAFVIELEKLVESKKAYTLSTGAGSRPQKKKDIVSWINQQRIIFKQGNIRDAEFTLDVNDFPPSPSGCLHVTTAKNVFYLVDSVKDVLSALQSAYPRLSKLKISGIDQVLVYISNSIKPGRIFGDPYTGQITAFINIFAKDLSGSKIRTSIAYFPHQSHVQAFEGNTFKKNKGITIMRELLDYAIFYGGIALDFNRGEVI